VRFRRSPITSRSISMSTACWRSRSDIFEFSDPSPHLRGPQGPSAGRSSVARAIKVAEHQHGIGRDHPGAVEARAHFAPGIGGIARGKGQGKAVGKGAELAVGRGVEALRLWRSIP
jgi:hypothetical protein